ncbi:protein CURVATURE THYLAKOID 1B, chloroplastic-like [Vigna unguiculata]|uniref:Cyanobacterial aminoacyl-tRNA synthetase n=1 Tax=Vigna unguiculata TaxID=3917 RepID=A0A4D6MP42_VIGUN|nr:protein CURVATURE THYLAKOID 1B, chloroplastic-like [Vigna unguiculata]QCE02481.1 Cyanobacterial aminoacyl-tRNA synthetase [Vigna unguiculata]
MASTSSALTISSSSTLFDGKAPRNSPPLSPQCVTLPLPNFHSQNRSWKTSAYNGKIARNVMAMATGEAPAEASSTEVPEIVKTLQETWDKVDDKYAVSSLALIGVIALWGSVGLISAIDRLPLIPGILEIVGIGYTGWFVYKNIVFKPDREKLTQKVKETYNEILGSNELP